MEEIKIISGNEISHKKSKIQGSYLSLNYLDYDFKEIKKKETVYSRGIKPDGIRKGESNIEALWMGRVALEEVIFGWMDQRGPKGIRNG